MKKIFLIIYFSLISLTVYSANLPSRQKIELLGVTKVNIAKKMSITQIEKDFKFEEFIINDPYNKDLLTHFYGFNFWNLLEKYSEPGIKSVKVTAVDGYSVLINLKDIKDEKMILVFKDKNGYLSVDRMGPIRIIYPLKGVINKEFLLKIGVNWVWQIKSFEFLK
jgi:hypothetical protein